MRALRRLHRPRFGAFLPRVGSTLAALVLCGLASACTYSIIDGSQVRQEDLDRISQATQEVRGLTTQQEIRPQVVNQAELHGVLREALLSDWTPEEIERAERGMVAMGLWPRERDLLTVYLDVLTQEVAGLYVPQTKQLYLVRDFQTPISVQVTQGLARRDLMRELILSHEIIHLLQDEAYPKLLASDQFLHQQDDLAYALQASFEGDATHYGLLAVGVEADALPSPDELREAMAHESQIARDVPAIVKRSLVFPYANGYELSRAEGPALLDRPPISTEQVLHIAQRYEPFLAFDLRTLDALLPGRCQRVYENTVGELALSVLFEEASREPEAAAWEGWDGDRYLVVDCAGRLEFIWATSWDSPEDALEFARAYDAIAAWVAKRKQRGGRPMVVPRGREVWVATAGLAGRIEQYHDRALRRRIGTIPELRSFFE